MTVTIPRNELKAKLSPLYRLDTVTEISNLVNTGKVIGNGSFMEKLPERELTVS